MILWSIPLFPSWKTSLCFAWRFPGITDVRYRVAAEMSTIFVKTFHKIHPCRKSLSTMVLFLLIYIFTQVLVFKHPELTTFDLYTVFFSRLACTPDVGLVDQRSEMAAKSVNSVLEVDIWSWYLKLVLETWTWSSLRGKEPSWWRKFWKSCHGEPWSWYWKLIQVVLWTTITGTSGAAKRYLVTDNPSPINRR